MAGESSGVLVTFEGGEGSGKSTVCTQVFRLVGEAGFDCWKGGEPGATPLGAEWRRQMLNPASPLAPQAELFLFLADRAQNFAENVAPRLARGEVVFLDRHRDSTVAYQGAGRCYDVQFIAQANDFATSKTNRAMLAWLLRAELLAADGDTEFIHSGRDDVDGADASELFTPHRSGDCYTNWISCPLRLARNPDVTLNLAFDFRTVRDRRTRLDLMARRAAARWRAEISDPRPPDPSQPFHKPELMTDVAEHERSTSVIREPERYARLPDLTILLDISPEDGLRRSRRTEFGEGVADRFESEDIAFHARLRDEFLEIAKSEPDRVVVLDASAPLADIVASAHGLVTRMLARKGVLPKASGT